MTTINSAFPKYSLHQTVDYRDHQGRIQTGEISRIEAHWADGDPEPLIFYAFNRPDCHNGRYYRSEREIMR